MLYFTGDTHGEVTRFRELAALGECSYTSDDILFITGDFGYIFKDNTEERRFLNELEERPYTIAFCDGNHENFNALYSYAEEIWNGGRVHRIRRNIVHLMRGEIYNIGGKKLFAMGGAYSVDKYMRTEGRSWWPEELPSAAEYDNAIKNLEANGNKVDYIITHTAPREMIRRLGFSTNYHDDELTGFLEWIMHEVEYKKWYFGHLHLDIDVTSRHRALYFDVVKGEL